jgi:hypothetical protein
MKYERIPPSERTGRTIPPCTRTKKEPNLRSIIMTKENGRCDGKNCFHEFTEGEDYVYLEEDPESIYCTRECAIEAMGDPFRYGTFGEEEDGST